MKGKILALNMVILVLVSVAIAHTGHQEHEGSEVQQNATSEEEQKVQQITDQYPEWAFYAAGGFIALTAVLVIVGLNMYLDQS